MNKVLVETEFDEAIRSRLSEDDDPKLWAAVFDALTGDFESLYAARSAKHEIFLQIGACSHWLRPHQTRLTAAGGFACPTGYLGGDFAWKGLPEFDWFVILHYDRDAKRWESGERFFGKKKLICRVALPTRTRRHSQAAINVLWSPGTPEHPDRKAATFYGFRKIAGDWKCVASGQL